MASTLPPSAPAASRRGPTLAARRVRLAWIYLLPTIVTLAAVAGYPLYRTVQLSFTDVRLRFPLAPEWVGLDNYTWLLRDPVWWRSVWNTLVFTFVSVGIETVLGILIALMVASGMRGKGLMRTAMLVPWAIPGVVAAQMWKWMLNDVYGVINDLFMRLRLIDEPKAWLASAALMMPSVIAIDVWKTTPFMALILLAGLQSIPQEYYEAARVDGANAWQRFWRITLPLLAPALAVALIFRTLDALRVFDMIFITTGAQISTISMSIYARQQLVSFFDLGYGSAVATGIFLVIAFYVAVYLAIFRRALR